MRYWTDKIKILVLILFCGWVNTAKAQYEVSTSLWFDEYSVQHHINQYLSNELLSFEYYQKWNPETQEFELALPSRLTYFPFASREIEVNAIELDYTQRGFLLKWDNFSAEKIDSLLKTSKLIYSTQLRYDEQGRLTHSTYKNFKHKPFGERIDYRIAYNQTEPLSGFSVEINWSDGLILKKNRNSTAQYFFGKNQSLLEVSVSHQSERESSAFKVRYSNDSLGRLTSSRREPVSEVFRDRNHSYESTPFVLDSVQEDYRLLKIPSIQHWLRSYPDSGLSIISYQKFERNRNATVEYSYLVDSEQNRLLMLRPYSYYFGENEDSNSITRSYCGISRSQNLNDTIPYDPNYEPRYIGTFYSQCSIEERYTTPPGLVNAGSVECYKRSEHSLSNGWKRVTYQRGSSAPSRFAPGYPASVRYDIRFDKHLILDQNGAVRYIIDYDKLIKLEEVEGAVEGKNE